MTTVFEPSQVVLSKMMERISAGNVQLPDFQRGWVWSDYHIRSLLQRIEDAMKKKVVSEAPGKELTPAS